MAAFGNDSGMLLCKNLNPAIMNIMINILMNIIIKITDNDYDAKQNLYHYIQLLIIMPALRRH